MLGRSFITVYHVRVTEYRTRCSWILCRWQPAPLTSDAGLRPISAPEREYLVPKDECEIKSEGSKCTCGALHST